MDIIRIVSDKLYLLKEKKRLEAWRQLMVVYVAVFIIWGLYRLLFRFPVWLEEVVFKALVFGLPVFYLVPIGEKKDLVSLGITSKRLFEAIYLGLGLGVIFGFLGQIGNFVRHGGSLILSDYGLSSGSVGGFLGLALVTAGWEELLFMGYMLPRLIGLVGREWYGIGLTAVFFSLVHLPAIILSGAMGSQVLLQLILLWSLGVGNGVLMVRTKNLAAPILTHALWGVTIFMFR